MWYSAEALVEAAFTVAAVNTQIAAVNTALGTSGTAVAERLNALVKAPKDGTTWPLLTYMVGGSAGEAGLRRFGARDTLVPVVVQYLSRHTTMASAKTDVQVALEAVRVVLETLPGTQHGSTARYCVDVRDGELEMVAYRVSEEVVRHGGELRFTMVMRTEG